MPRKAVVDLLFCDYFEKWVDTYKAGMIADATLRKYRNTGITLRSLAPALQMQDLDRSAYQRIITKYAETHEKQTVMDFNTQLTACIRDAFDERVIDRDPTRKVVITGKAPPASKKKKWLNEVELQKLLTLLDLNNINDRIIFVAAKTGARFGEIVALTPSDFDFEGGKMTISKTWNYKDPDGGIMPTKNLSSVRTIDIDPGTVIVIKTISKNMASDQPIFRKGRIFNSTVNNRLSELCKDAGITVVSTHALRHTHASLLIYAGVSVQSVSKRLGHSNTGTTQNVYMHIVDELARKDGDKAMQYLGEMA